MASSLQQYRKYRMNLFTGRMDLTEINLEDLNLAFTQLRDTPSDYTGAASKYVRVNAAGDGLEFVSGSGGSGNSIYIEENDIAVGDNASLDLTLDFLGADFNLSYIAGNNEINIEIEDSGINHNATTNYVANEHIDHSTISIIAGSGLSGGGTIDNNVTLSVDNTTLDHGLLTGLLDDDHTQYALVTTFEPTRAAISTKWTDLTDGGETSLHTHAASTPAAHAPTHEIGGSDLVDHNNLTNYDPNRHIDHTTVSVIAGTALTGGGTIDNNITLNVDASNISHSSLANLNSDDHVQYPLVTTFEADRATISTKWTDLTDGGSTTLHTHPASAPAAHASTHELGGSDEIDHNRLLNYVTYEHIKHQKVIISGGNGLSGGGDITSSRTITLDLCNLSNSTISDITNDVIGFCDYASSTTYKTTISDLFDAATVFVRRDGTLNLTGHWDTGGIYNINNLNRLGIGTTTIPHGSIGCAKIAIDGGNSSSNGPHIQITTNSDDHPLYQLLSWSHDNITQCYDCYYDGTVWKSSDGGSNFRVRKYGDTYRIEAAQSIAQGSTIAAFNTAIKVNSNARVTLNESQSLDADFMVKTSSFAPLFFVDSSADKIWIGDGSTPTGGYSGVYTEEDYSSLSFSGATSHVVNTSGTLDFTSTVGTDWVTSFGVCGLFSANANKTGAGYALYGEAKAVNDASPGSYDDPILIGVEGAVFVRDGWYGYTINAQPYLANSSGTASFMSGLYITTLQRESSLGSMTCNDFAAIYIEDPNSNSLISGNMYSIYAETGECVIAPDLDTDCIFGRTVIGTAYSSDSASFSHYDQNSGTGYAIAQTSAGITRINAASTSASIDFCIANTRKMQLHGNGDFSIDTTGFYYDDSTNRVGLGTASPTVQLHVLGSGTAKVGNTDTVLILQHSDSSSRNVGINMISGTSGVCSIFVGDTSSTSVGKIEYSNSSNQWRFKANNTWVSYLKPTGIFSYTHKGKDLGSASLSWDDVYGDDFFNTCEAFTNKKEAINIIKQINYTTITKNNGKTETHIDKATLPAFVRGKTKKLDKDGNWIGKFINKDGKELKLKDIENTDNLDIILKEYEWCGEYDDNQYNDALSINRLQTVIIAALKDIIETQEKLIKKLGGVM